MNSSPGIWPPANTVQTVSRFFVDLGELGQQLYYGIHAFIFFALLFLALYCWWVEQAVSTRLKHFRIREIVSSDWTFLILVIAFILMARIPLASTGILNPDEPYWVAEAKALLKDNRPWVSVDTGTGGPLTPLTLLSLKVFGLPIDQGSIKVLGGLIVALSTVCVYIGLSIVKGSSFSRLIILPLVIAFSILRAGDLTAYNSEHPAMLVLCIAFVLFCRLYSGSGTNLVNLFFLGFFLGVVPYAKLQGIPIAFFLGITSCFIAIKRLPMVQTYVLIVGALAPTLLTLLALWSYDGLYDFWIGYFQYNISYTSETAIQGDGLMSRMKLFFDLVFRAQDLHFFLYVSLAIMSVGTVSLFLRNKIMKSDIAEILFSLALVGVSIFSITAPGRPFLHYLLFLPIPLTIVSAVIFAIAVRGSAQNSGMPQPSRRLKLLVGLGFIICMSLFYFKGIALTKIDFQGRAKENYDGYAPQGLVGAVLDHYFSSGARIAVWEYEPELFEGTDFLPGTRDVATAFHLQGKLSDYYASRYLKDLNTNQPSLFVESTTRSTHGIDHFLRIHEYIAENYVQDALVDGYKIYVRNDELTKDRGWTVKKDLDVKSVSEFHSDLQALTQNGSFLYFRGWTVFRENVTDQRVFLILKSEQDTLFIPSHQLSNSAVADFSGKQNYLMCGFLGFIPITKIPKGNYNVWLQVENNDETGLKQINRTLNTDSLLME